MFHLALAEGGTGGSEEAKAGDGLRGEVDLSSKSTKCSSHQQLREEEDAARSKAALHTGKAGQQRGPNRGGDDDLLQPHRHEVSSRYLREVRKREAKERKGPPNPSLDKHGASQA